MKMTKSKIRILTQIENDYGSCQYNLEQDADGSYMHIYNLYIEPKFRKQGHAKELLKFTIKHIRDSGYEGEIAVVAAPEEDSISKEDLTNFYESLGLTVY